MRTSMLHTKIQIEKISNFRFSFRILPSDSNSLSVFSVENAYALNRQKDRACRKF